MESLYISIGLAASMIGVSTKTLRCWDKKRSFSSTFRTKENHRRYCRSKILDFIRQRKGHRFQKRKNIRAVIYGRVSASK
ncbi:MAG: MerR family DNA-binding transcriptional regulator [Promethearchaeota archaeon]